MGNTSNPFNKKRVVRAQFAVFGLSVVGIGVFLGFWILLGEAGVGNHVRMIGAFCIPLVVIAAIVGAYIALRSSRPAGEE